ncbi:MAG: hypothetical protein ABH828_04095 [archaeon]
MSKEEIIYTMITNWEELSDLVFNESSKGKTIFRELENRLPKEYKETLNGNMSVEQFFDLVQEEMGVQLRRPTLNSKIVNEKKAVELNQKGIQIVRVLNKKMMDNLLPENEIRDLTQLRIHHDEANPIYYEALQSSNTFELIVSKSIAYALSSVAYFNKRRNNDVDWIVSNINNYESPVVIESGISWGVNVDKISEKLKSTHNVQLKILEQIAVEGENCNPDGYLYAPHVRLRRGLIKGTLSQTEMEYLAAQDIVYSQIIDSKPENYDGHFPKSYMSSIAKEICKELSITKLKTLFPILRESNGCSFEQKIDIVKS